MRSGDTAPEAESVVDADGDGCLGEDDLARDTGASMPCDDCDDADPAVNSRADEICGNAVDEDCSGAIDDVTWWYVDADGDGWGGEYVEGCEAPEGSVGRGLDCDDTNAAIYPGALEVWFDGEETDCYGGDGVVGATSVVEAGTAVVAVGSHAGRALLGVSLGGMPQVVVGGEGAVAIAPLPLTLTTFAEAPTVILSDDAAFGEKVFADGEQLVFPVIGEDPAVWIVDPPSGTVDLAEVGRALTAEADLPLADVAAGEDVDGDGIGDLVLLFAEYGDRLSGGEDGYGTFYPVESSVWFVSGPLDSLGELSPDQSWSDSTYDWARTPLSAALTGDLDGDGYGDVAASAGSTRVYALGDADPAGSLPSGRIFPVGDLDGDALADILIANASDDLWMVAGPVEGGRIGECRFSNDVESVAVDDGTLIVGVGVGADGRYGAVLPVVPDFATSSSCNEHTGLYGPAEGAGFGDAVLVDSEILVGAPELGGGEGGVYRVDSGSLAP